MPPPYITFDHRLSPHYGYGILNGYAPVTASLHDYRDLLNHYQLTAAICYNQYKRTYGDKFTEIRESLDKDKTKNSRRKSAKKTDGGSISMTGVVVEDRPVTVPKSYPLSKHLTMVELGRLVPKIEIRRSEIALLEACSKRYWVLCNIKREKEDGRLVAYKAIVITAKDNRGETIVRLLKFHINVTILLPKHRKVSKGEEIFLSVRHVDPYYDRLIMDEIKHIPKVSERKQIEKMAQRLQPPQEPEFPLLPFPHNLLGPRQKSFDTEEL